LRDWQVVLAKYTACFVFYVLLWVPTLTYLPWLLDLKVTGMHLVVTPFSILWVAGLGAALLGLLLLIPRVGTSLRIVSLALLVGGTAVACVGGRLHYAQDSTHLIDIAAGLDPAPVVTLYIGMALAGAMFLALGLFVSSLVRDQLVA